LRARVRRNGGRGSRLTESGEWPCCCTHPSLRKRHSIGPVGGPSLAVSAYGRLLTTSSGPAYTGGSIMLWTIAVILLVLWAIGLVSSYTIGGFIHILLVIAVVVLIIRLIQGRPVV